MIGPAGHKDDDEVEVASELTRGEREGEVASSSALSARVGRDVEAAQAWYRELQRTKLADMQALVLAGKPQQVQHPDLATSTSTSSSSSSTSASRSSPPS